MTVSADVATTTHLSGWVNRRGVYTTRERDDAFERHGLRPLIRWKESPAGQHLELGIGEASFFVLLSVLGLAPELAGRRLLPIGTLYDCFLPRGLDPLLHATYSKARFILVASPSGISLAPEGGAHQSVVTPALGIEVPNLRAYEPTFAKEVEWLLLDALRHDPGSRARRGGVPAPVDQDRRPGAARARRSTAWGRRRCAPRCCAEGIGSSIARRRSATSPAPTS